MADAYYDYAKELLKKPGIQLSSKATQWDRVYVETIPKAVSKEHPTYPKTADDTLHPNRIPGVAHPKCPYLILIDSYAAGGDDHHYNWNLTYKLDIRAFAAAYPDEIPDWQDELAKDGVTTSHPYEDSTPTIDWTFTIVNPDSYTKPTQGTAHPTIATCLFINESWQRDGQTLTVSRHYEKIAPQADQRKIGYTVNYEYPEYPIVTWTYDTLKTDFTPPTVNQACGITGFTALKVIKPADVPVKNGLTYTVTLTYGLLSGPVITLDALNPDDPTKVTTYQQRRAIADTFSAACNSYSMVEENGYSEVWQWTALTPAIEAVAGLVGWFAQEEYQGFDVVSWTFTAPRSTYAKPAVNASCPVTGYTSLKIIKPPEIKTLDTQNVRVTHTYANLPGPAIRLPQINDGPAGLVDLVTQRRAMADDFDDPCLGFTTTRDDGYSKDWQWVELRDDPEIHSYPFDAETGLIEHHIEQVIDEADAAGEVEDVNADGQYVTVAPINVYHSLKRTVEIALLAQKPEFEHYSFDPETEDRVKELVQVVELPDVPAEPKTLGTVVTQRQINTLFALRTTRSIDGVPTSYDTWEWVDFTVPGIVPSGGVVAGTGGDSTFAVEYPNRREPYSKKLKGTVYVDFFTAKPARGTLLQILPSGAYYRGSTFVIDLRGYLVNGDTFSNSGMDVSESFTWSDSTPSASAYLAMVGSEQLYQERISRFWTGHWKRERVYIIPE